MVRIGSRTISDPRLCVSIKIQSNFGIGRLILEVTEVKWLYI